MDARNTLERLGAGQAMEDLHAAVLDVAEVVVATGRRGSVTLKLTIDRGTPGEPTVTISEEVHRRVPPKESRGAYFWLHDGEMHREDPRQAQFDLRVVEPEGSDVRDTEVPQNIIREERS